MRKYGLIGYPLGHSFSKSWFTEKFSREDIKDCSYENFPLPEIGLLPGLLGGEPDLCGLNVTIPYKKAVFRYVDVFDPEALEVGAVNVLKIVRNEKNYRILGYNSDVTGISGSVEPYLDRGIRNALVLGTGGSSGAVCHVLRRLGFTVTLVSRRRSEGILGYSDLDREVLSGTDLIVNTTPLGMYPDTGTRPELDYSLLTDKHILFDLVYNPEYTFFLRSGQERGCTVITGLNMLHIQAEKSWEIWNAGNVPGI